MAEPEIEVTGEGLGCFWVPIVLIVCVTAYKIAELYFRYKGVHP